MELLDFLLANFAVVIWAVAISIFSIFTILVPMFIWRISANVAAIREEMEVHLYKKVRR